MTISDSVFIKKAFQDVSNACKKCGDSFSELGATLGIFSARKPRRKRTKWKSRRKI